MIEMGASVIEQAILRAKEFATSAWCKAIDGDASKCVGTPKKHKGFTFQIEQGGVDSLAEGVFFNNDCSIYCRDSVTIGTVTNFRDAVRIYDDKRRFNRRDVSIPERGYAHAPVAIGRDCRIGGNEVILKGAPIGDNCVIGTGCVVSGDIPADCLCTASRELQISKVRYRDE